jgi:hypothetical protein
MTGPSGIPTQIHLQYHQEIPGLVCNANLLRVNDQTDVVPYFLLPRV